VPALAGLAAPVWAPAAPAAFVGMGNATERGHLVRAVVEGIAAQVAVLCDAIETDLGASLARLRVDGGLTRSRVLLQAQADLLQRPIEVYPSPHATAIGVAALARLGAGAVRDARNAVPPWSPSATYEPQIDTDAAAERLAEWRRVATAATQR
jgi:glycerol kinase